MKCTMLKMELVDGREVELTLNFARLLKVKNHNKKLYEEFNKSLQNKEFDVIFDSIKVIYVAYLCANSDKLGTNEVLKEDEFLELIPMDLTLIGNLVAELIQTKKK